MAKDTSTAPTSTAPAFDDKEFGKALRRVTQDVKYLKANGATSLSPDTVSKHCADMVAFLKAAK